MERSSLVSVSMEIEIISVLESQLENESEVYIRSPVDAGLQWILVSSGCWSPTACNQADMVNLIVQQLEFNCWYSNSEAT